jgi:hypothetical protein
MAKRITLSDGNRVNSKGFRIDLSGMNTERFSDNPVMLHEHQKDKVIGRWENWTITGNRLQADPVFDDGDTLGAEIKRKYEGDFLRAASIGLIVLDMQPVDGVPVVTKSELIEASIVSIPADAGAVVLYNEKREVITFEQLKLSFSIENRRREGEPNNNKISKTMDEKDTIVLTAATRQSLSLSANYTAKQIELAVAEKDDKIDELNKKIDKLETAHVESYLSQAVKDGKITEKEKADYVKLSQGDNFENVKSIIDAKQTEGSLSLKDLADKSKTILTAGDRAGWNFLKWAKEDHKGLERLKHENPTEYERLKTEYSQSNQS